MPSFSVQSPNLAATGPVFNMRLWVPPKLEEVLNADNKEIPTQVDVMAMIDTGATSTVIQEGLAVKLGIKPLDTEMINTPTTDGHECYKYHVRLLFPNGVVAEVVAIEAPLVNQHIQLLIGRDVLTQGVLVYTGFTNSFSLSF